MKIISATILLNFQCFLICVSVWLSRRSVSEKNCMSMKVQMKSFECGDFQKNDQHRSYSFDIITSLSLNSACSSLFPSEILWAFSVFPWKFIRLNSKQKHLQQWIHRAAKRKGCSCNERGFLLQRRSFLQQQLSRLPSPDPKSKKKLSEINKKRCYRERPDFWKKTFDATKHSKLHGTLHTKKFWILKSFKNFPSSPKDWFSSEKHFNISTFSDLDTEPNNFVKYKNEMHKSTTNRLTPKGMIVRNNKSGLWESKDTLPSIVSYYCVGTEQK